MSAAKHTPGPWKAGRKTVTAPETDERCALDARLYGGNADNLRANARLIAAAPDLLAEAAGASEQLQALLACLSPILSDTVRASLDARIATLDAAIAKATKGAAA